jgi:superfamily I DNA/RNA helicase
VYLRSCRRKGEKLKTKPRVNLETIHGSKGGECQNVVIMTDLPTKADDEYIHNPDDECRVFYTGVTRAKEHLHIITPQTDRFFSL